MKLNSNASIAVVNLSQIIKNTSIHMTQEATTVFMSAAVQNVIIGA